MRHALRLAAVALLLRGASAGAQEAVTPEIVTSASAERPVRANLALVTLRFNRSGTTPAAAGRNLALKADSVRAAMRRLGIPTDSVVNQSRWWWWRDRIRLEVTPRSVERWVVVEGTRFRRDTTVHDTTYRADESLQVRIRDMGRVGAVVEAALAQGITEISDIQFSATDTEEEQTQAVMEATRLARARAEIIAEAGGGRLGGTLRLSTEGDGSPTVRHGPFDVIGFAASGGSTAVVAPVLRVSATVQGRWILLESGTP